MDPETEQQEHGVADGESVAREYSATLSELDTPSKVEINALTMLAEDHKEFAVQITKCIESHLRSVPSRKQLPILYLIDSICKNHPRSSYVRLFTQNIVSNFCEVFKLSNENGRKRLRKLLTTWYQTKTFPEEKLKAMERRIATLDPRSIVRAAPIGASSERQAANNATARQTQQRITRAQATISLEQQKMVQPTPVVPPPPATLADQQLIQATLTTAEQQQRILQPTVTPAPYIFAQPSTIGTMMDIEMPLMTGLDSLPQQQQQQAQNQHHQQLQQQQQLQQHHQNQQQQPQLSQPQHQQQSQQQNLLPDNLDVTLNSLYGGKQCSNCSLRFDDKHKYAVHLDWHFRQNLKSDPVFARRKWYYPLNLWVQFREINDEEVQENVVPDNGVNDLIVSQNDHEVPTAPASKEDEKNICSVCHEAFEKFWAEEEEEWRLKNARQHDDSMVYHPLCLIDMLQSSNVSDSVVQ